MIDRDAVFEKIVQDLMNIPTLRTQGNDSLDFHDVAVWSIRQAMVLAYELGREAQKAEATK